MLFKKNVEENKTVIRILVKADLSKFEGIAQRVQGKKIGTFDKGGNV